MRIDLSTALPPADAPPPGPCAICGGPSEHLVVVSVPRRDRASVPAGYTALIHATFSCCSFPTTESVCGKRDFRELAELIYDTITEMDEIPESVVIE